MALRWLLWGRPALRWLRGGRDGTREDLGVAPSSTAGDRPDGLVSHVEGCAAVVECGSAFWSSWRGGSALGSIRGGATALGRALEGASALAGWRRRPYGAVGLRSAHCVGRAPVVECGSAPWVPWRGRSALGKLRGGAMALGKPRRGANALGATRRRISARERRAPARRAMRARCRRLARANRRAATGIRCATPSGRWAPPSA